MDAVKTLELLGNLPGFERDEDGVSPVEPILNPFGVENELWRYSVTADSQIEAVKMRGDKQIAGPVCGSLRQLLWNKLRLDRVCEAYQNQYEEWKASNNGVEYISATVLSEDRESHWDSEDFVRQLWSDPENNQGGLWLLMAEYGMGKSSFCQGVRTLTAREIKEPFLNGEAAFPLVFDLNEFRNQDFDEFIQNRVIDRYQMPLSYRCFEMLCRAGIFLVVLDAWDQMHGTPSERQTIRDISQFRSLWDENGRVLITCRRSFYQKQLHMKQSVFGEESMRQARLFALGGFDKQSVEAYFRAVGIQSLAADDAWLEQCWRLNSDLLERPLNLRLLFKHAELITERYDLSSVKIDTYQFLELVLKAWQSDLKRDSLLKPLVMLTLRSGLNRSVFVQAYKEQIGESVWNANEAALRKLEFISVREEEIEFRLAAYQEFLWAHYVIQELNARQLCNYNTLLNRFLLTPETRAWIKNVLSQEENNCLKIQLDLLLYKNRAETGFSGGNALTLWRDLNHIDYYKRSLAEQQLNDRPLHGADLHGLNLSGLNFRRSDLFGANLSYTKLDGADFTGANLTDLVIDDYGELTKCAFLDQASGPCVVSGTEAGSVMTYSISQRREEAEAQADDTIRDISADSAGVYTASADGWVGYIDKEGHWRNAYIAAAGLQSIVSGAKGAVYVGVHQNGLYRYNWERGSKHRIQVFDEQGKEVHINEMEGIIYYPDEKNDGRYIAYLSETRRLLTIVELSGLDNGTVVCKCRLQGGSSFGDCCFADDNLVYSVTGMGVYSWPIDRLFGKIGQDALTVGEHLVYRTQKPVMLAWARDTHRLFVLEKEPGTLEKITGIEMNGREKNSMVCELEWVLFDRSFAVQADRLNGFCVSSDGRYLALSGERLAVFVWQQEEGYYALLSDPVEARITCRNAKFQKCDGLPPTLQARLQKGGAIT